MKVLDKYGKYRLVETIGNYMEHRYEVQEEYKYLEHIGDTEFTTGWHMVCWSHDLNWAKKAFEKRKEVVS